MNSYLYPIKLNFNNWLELLNDINQDNFWYYLNVSYDCKIIDDPGEFVVRNLGKLKSVKTKLRRPRRRPYSLPD